MKGDTNHLKLGIEAVGGETGGKVHNTGVICIEAN